MNYENLDKLKQKLDSFRPLKKEIVKNLREDLILKWTYNSNAIEGNTLTLKETKVVLEGVTIGGKTLREHLEAINHREAIFYLEDLVKEITPLSEANIKSLHQLILKGIDDTNAGRYRRVNVVIAGAKNVPPDYLHVQDEMAAFIDWYKKEKKNLHPVELAAMVHSDFVKIHPFVDGNGRTARLLMNLELMKAGFPPAVLPVEKRLEYYNALDMAHIKNNYIPFLNLMMEIVEKSFKPYWYALGID